MMLLLDACRRRLVSGAARRRQARALCSDCLTPPSQTMGRWQARRRLLWRPARVGWRGLGWGWELGRQWAAIHQCDKPAFNGRACAGASVQARTWLPLLRTVACARPPPRSAARVRHRKSPVVMSAWLRKAASPWVKKWMFCRCLAPYRSTCTGQPLMLLLASAPSTCQPIQLAPAGPAGVHAEGALEPLGPRPRRKVVANVHGGGLLRLRLRLEGLPERLHCGQRMAMRAGGRSLPVPILNWKGSAPSAHLQMHIVRTAPWPQAAPTRHGQGGGSVWRAGEEHAHHAAAYRQKRRAVWWEHRPS